VPNDERSDFLWPEFLLPFPPPPRVWGPNSPLFWVVFPVLGGVPFRPGPFFAIFGPFLPKNEQNGALAYIGEAPAWLAKPDHTKGQGRAKHAVREPPIELLSASQPSLILSLGGRWSKIRAK
jgi:hypothetical protein